jgi:hypothetical protein
VPDEVPYLTWIDHCYRQIRCRGFTGGRDFIAAAGLEHDTGYGRVLLPVLKIHLTIGFGGEDYLTLTR